MKLDTAKAADFRERRVQIQNGILNICEQWAQVGKWLADVKERELYKHDPDNPEQTWKGFCERVCGFSRRKADQLIQSTNVRQAIAEAFGAEGMSMIPITERATREYAKVEPQQAVKDIKATVEAKQKPTTTTAKAARKAREAVVIEAEISEHPVKAKPAIEPVPTIDALLEDLNFAWSFDDNQQHTHSWHDKQDFMEKWRVAIARARQQP